MPAETADRTRPPARRQAPGDPRRRRRGVRHAGLRAGQHRRHRRRGQRLQADHLQPLRHQGAAVPDLDRRVGRPAERRLDGRHPRPRREHRAAGRRRSTAWLRRSSSASARPAPARCSARSTPRSPAIRTLFEAVRTRAMEPIIEALTGRLAMLGNAGLLRLPDPRLAARQFLALIAAELPERTRLGTQGARRRRAGRGGGRGRRHVSARVRHQLSGQDRAVDTPLRPPLPIASYAAAIRTDAATLASAAATAGPDAPGPDLPRVGGARPGPAPRRGAALGDVDRRHAAHRAVERGSARGRRHVAGR